MTDFEIWVGVCLTVIAIYYLVALLRMFVGGPWRNTP